MSLNKYLHEAITGEPYLLAEYVYEKYKEKFVYTNNNQWYEFKNHKWNLLDGCYSLRIIILEDVCNDFNNLINDSLLKIKNKIKPLYDINILQKTISNIRRVARLNEIIELLKPKFYTDKFEEMLDTNPDLICFKNGVYDLKTFEFRDGKALDNISLSTNIDYKPYDENDIKTKELINILKDILIKPQIYEYVIDILASCLNGYPDQKFHCWEGSGGNGKSILGNNLIKEAFGDYYVVVETTMITRKKQASYVASPDKVRLKGRRIGILNEPEGNDSIKVGHMKELTGSDTITARGLFKSPISFKPQFKLVMLCNVKPKVESDDDGTWRRIRVVNFETKFVEKPKKEYERKMDRTLEGRIKDYAKEFMGLLIEQYKKNIKNEINEPEEVILKTIEYKENNIKKKNKLII